MNYQLVAFILAVSSDADPAVKMPTGISPTLVVVQAKGTNLVSEQMVTATKSVPVTEEMVVDGKTVKRTTIKRITEQRKVSNSYSTDGATFQTAGGRKLEKEEALKKLTSPTLVVMSGDGQPVDEGFLAAFKPGTLVVVLPKAASGTLIGPRPPIRPLPAIRLPAIVPPAAAPPVKEDDKKPAR